MESFFKDVIFPFFFIFLIAAPSSVEALDSTDASARICWTSPETGPVSRYLVRFVETGQAMEAQEISVSAEDVEQPMSHQQSSESRDAAGDGGLTTTTRMKYYCATVTRLKPWTEYEFTVRGREGDEVGLPSETTRFDTKPDCELRWFYFCFYLSVEGPLKLQARRSFHFVVVKHVVVFISARL
jgi:hypothetical protein